MMGAIKGIFCSLPNLTMYLVKKIDGGYKKMQPKFQETKLGYTAVFLCIDVLRLCLVRKFWKIGYCSTFVFIWQLLFNHRLIRLKTFVSRFPTKLCN